MGVFNAAANQVLFSPVTEYYKGKAIRTQQAAAEQEMEIRQKTLEGMDDKAALEERRVAATEAQYRVEPHRKVVL